MLAQTLEYLTKHAVQRMQQRAISPAALDIVLRWGARIEQNGATVFFLSRRHLPADLAPAAARMEGTVAVVARDGAVLTTFCRRRRRLPKVMRRRPRSS